ncbi:MAG: hypothetical protein KAX53_01055 [Saprospiraceae bacterium]|jgi:ABC-type Fe3+-citrate transport system substrate-binding protein|nr:hypothetical protein [Saprospiraceae bacterium]MBK6664662.1 hypothetical protein [Saprospiraceae bacterium]MBK7698716.1 hypothetical protein [Saprospiraceae bacterium]MBK8826345.1 hypothetical protein [Saprospiraceae bacterium]MBK8885054.1 hypothetical protein [Saprospiraceae bacterium]
MSQTDRFLELEKELSPYKKILAQASDVILDEGVSKYPIFVIHQQEMDMGVLLIQAGTKFRWSVNASTLEEFVTKEIIFHEKAQEFIATYKDPEIYLCLFVLSELGAQFVFLPR